MPPQHGATIFLAPRDVDITSLFGGYESWKTRGSKITLKSKGSQMLVILYIGDFPKASRLILEIICHGWSTYPPLTYPPPEIRA